MRRIHFTQKYCFPYSQQWWKFFIYEFFYAQLSPLFLLATLPFPPPSLFRIFFPHSRWEWNEMKVGSATFSQYEPISYLIIEAVHGRSFCCKIKSKQKLDLWPFSQQTLKNLSHAPIHETILRILSSPSLKLTMEFLLSHWNIIIPWKEFAKFQKCGEILSANSCQPHTIINEA